MAEIALNALNLLANMVIRDRPKQCLQHSLGPDQNPIIGGSRMAEKACRSYHISRQGQPCNRGVFDLG